MKRSILLSLSILFSVLIFSQTTATDFTVDDCDGVTRNLFTELDEGKVIVIAWAMPWAGCVGPTLEAYQVVQSYAISHPGKVLYYMADDYANTPCTQIKSWSTSNGMGNCDSYFSDAAVSMSDYGTPGMPKVIVVGCADHKVYYNENYTAAGIGDAINEALEECSNLSVIDNNANYHFKLELYPNPVKNITNISFEMKESSDASIDILNIIGESVLNVSSSYYQFGLNEIQFNTEQLDNGLYFLRIHTGKSSQVVKFSVSK